ncbi:ComEA family DNA-binding protein [Galactobacter valiniphilus]|uniref:ComEA family DNA-binding protein n=1 Tax=Galactobacter valiniphilus TaxID=2676122 RepID=UPI003734EC21
MSYAAYGPRPTAGWRIVNSLWMLTGFLSLGLLWFLGFWIVAIRRRSSVLWYVAAVVVTALDVAMFVLTGLGIEDQDNQNLKNWSGVVMGLLMFAVPAVALTMNVFWLRWLWQDQLASGRGAWVAVPAVAGLPAAYAPSPWTRGPQAGQRPDGAAGAWVPGQGQAQGQGGYPAGYPGGNAGGYGAWGQPGQPGQAGQAGQVGQAARVGGAAPQAWGQPAPLGQFGQPGQSGQPGPPAWGAAPSAGPLQQAHGSGARSGAHAAGGNAAANGAPRPSRGTGPTPGTPPTGATGTGATPVIGGPQLDLNAASVAQLAALPGAGQALARAIVAERDARGAYARVSDLVARGVVQPHVFLAFSTGLFAGPLAAPPTPGLEGEAAARRSDDGGEAGGGRRLEF